MAQIIINTGNAINDGTGDPLRVAFNDVNNNFSQIWSAGLVGSNITIANNTIQVTNTNGNLNLATNGVGAIVARATIAPDQNGIRYIGTATNRFNTIYSQYLDATMLALSGNLYVAGNLQVVGNTVTNNYSNANIANLTITLAGGSSNAVLANNAGIIVHSANANLLYNYSANSWVSTIAISAPTFKGDGANLTNVVANVYANNLLGNTLRSTIINSNLTTVGTLTQLNAIGDISTTGNVYANIYTGNIVTANFLVGDGSNIGNINAVSVIGYVPTATFANTALVANLAALATQSINADTALFAINANLSNYSNNAVFAQHANTATYTVQADNANSARVAGMAYELIANADISVTGNLYVGNILTNGYYYANGTPFTGGNLIVSSNSLVNGNANVFLNSDGVLNLPVGHGYNYSATLVGTGTGANVEFQLNSDASGTATEWLSAVIDPGTGYSIGDEFTFDSTFLGIPGASLTLTVQAINGSGGVTDLSFTPPPLYPTSLYRQDGFIALQANDNRWTFGLNGNLTLPATVNAGASSVSINFAGVGYTTANNVPTYALTGSGTGMTVDIIASISGSHPITSVVINQHGTGYAVGDSIQVAQPGSTGNGTLIVVAITNIIPSINYANGTPYGGGGGNGSPGGSNTQVQFNDNGVFGGQAGFTFNKTSNTLSVANGIIANSISGGQLGTLGQIAFPLASSDVFTIVNNTGNLALITNATSNNLWNFDIDGNLTLPGNTSSINYANGQPYGGGSGPIGPDISITGNIVADGNISGSQLTAINGVVFNSKTINADFTLNGFNASSVGPVETAPGVTIDIIDGDWLIS